MSRIPLSPPHPTGNEQQAILDTLELNSLAPGGPGVELLERRFAERIGVRGAVGLASGTAAIHLTLRHLELRPGDEVWCSTLTFCASANPIVYERAQPVFFDCDAETWNLDVGLVEEELRTANAENRLPKAIIAVDIFGQSVDVDPLRQAADRFGVPIVQDSAESLGASYKQRPTGRDAWASVFSLNGNKIITASSGGVLCSDDEALLKQAAFLATQAKDPAPYYQHSQIGFNYRMSNILAAIANTQLDVLDDRVAARRRVRESYRSALSDLPGVTLMPEADYGQSNAWLTVLEIDPDAFGIDCEKLRLALEGRNIESRRVWKPLHLQPVFAGCRFVGSGVSERVFERGLCLPSGSAMTDSDIARVVSGVRESAGLQSDTGSAAA